MKPRLSIGSKAMPSGPPSTGTNTISSITDRKKKVNKAAKAMGLRHHNAKACRIHCQPWAGATG